MKQDDLKRRTKAFAIRVVLFVRTIPKNDDTTPFRKQLLRSGTSPGANYRAACRARSNADMIGKLKVVEEELDETLYWLELLEEIGFESPEVRPLWQEGNELLAITVATIKSLRDKP